MNRSFLSPVIQIACYVIAWQWHAAAVLVTFQVDLSIQESIERFDPNNDVVELRGGFNGWTGGTTMDQDADNTSIYRLDLDLADDPGATIEYKFVIFDGAGVVVWESDVGDGQANRAFVLEETSQTLPLAFFDNLSVDPGAGIDVTFQVDMAARIQDELFDAEVDFVEVRGPFNNWEGGTELAPREAGSTIYTSTVKVEFILPGSQVPYKYIINGGEWESGENRQFELENEAHTVPVRFFDDIEPSVVEPLGVLRISPAIDGSFTLTWDSEESVLQGATDFEEGWDDISDAAGKTEISLSTDLARTLFFRLVSPN